MSSTINSKRILIRILMTSVAILQAVVIQAQPVIKVSGGAGQTLFIKSDGSLWAMGANTWGQLGDGGIDYSTNRPERIVAGNVTAIAAGVNHSLFLKNGGDLWGMGLNGWGALGDTPAVDETSSHTNVPEEIIASNVMAIAAGSEFSLFLERDGSLWGMGLNQYGQLGDGGVDDFTNLPEQIVVSNVIAISAGSNHSLFIKSDGSLWGMGDNHLGQLGDGTMNQANFPEEIVASNVTAIAAGGEHSLFLKTDGSLWAMGNNFHGQLGDGTYNYSTVPEEIVASNVTAIAAGANHNLFLKCDGSLWSMGNNGNGQLGDGTTDGGNYQTNRPEQIIARGVTAIAAGQDHSLFIKSDGSLWAMGYNAAGQLGDGTYNDTNQPEQVVVNPAYNHAAIQLVSGGDVGLSYWGMAGTNYELDRTFSLSPANWIPQATNSTDSNGGLTFTNAPDVTTNNFWRIRSVP